MEMYDMVRLVRDMPELGLRKGMTGAILLTFRDPHEAYEVEFVDEGGRTIALATLTPDLIEVVEAKP
jgi:hypothetical protein